MKLKLTIKERLNLPAFLPQSSDILTIMAVSKIKEKIQIEIEEMERIKLKQDKDQVTWDPNLEKELEVKFGPTETQVLKDSVEKLDKDKKVNLDNLSFVIKIKDR